MRVEAFTPLRVEGLLLLDDLRLAALLLDGLLDVDSEMRIERRYAGVQHL